ncbi:unnamed protein product [Mytilus edulis]|uniref:Uncharacterized protein n=1 Tax=Mytilus edulis TaxID=6550 RepID=A0A8S3USH2_MYTED|nr:unnamed protein product [Mytilus edulis]
MCCKHFLRFGYCISLVDIQIQNRNEHIATIKDGTEIRRYVRIHVIGKDGVGKSSLVRTLVGDNNTPLKSTDGIDIVKKCKIRTTDGEWVIDKVETERTKLINRILKTVHKEQKQSEPVSAQVIPSEEETNEKERISYKEPLSEIERKQENQDTNVLNDVSLTMDTVNSDTVKSNIDKPMKGDVVQSTNDVKNRKIQ